MKSPRIVQEQDGATSSRRVFGLACLANSIALSWKSADWRIILIFQISALFVFGYITWQEIKEISPYKLADAVGGSSVGESEASESIGFKEN